jgi:hypothetical protein
MSHERLSEEAMIEILRERVEKDKQRTTPRGNGPDLDPLKAVTLDDFHAYMPAHSYIYEPTREMWPASSVNSRVAPVPVFRNGKPVLNKSGDQKTIPATNWLDRNKPVEQMTWCPGLPTLISDRLISEGGWFARKGVTVFNLYRPPMIEHGDGEKAKPWLDHVRKVFGADADHVIRWLAHRVQRPQEKINHALVLGGAQGVGKDTLLEPVKRAIGHWNFYEVSPQQVLGRFNGFLKSVILRVSEARDLGDVNRFQFYDHMKAFTAAPPDVLRVDEKHLREHSIVNVTGVIVTTNHKTDGIFLPADDRRHYVAWSERTKEDFAADYWNGLWGWYDDGGDAHVAAYLATLDLSGFDPKAPPPKTPAFWSIVDANRSSEDAELADVLDALRNPAAVTLSQIAAQAIAAAPSLSASGSHQSFEARHQARQSFWTFLSERKNRRAIHHRMEGCGYVPVRNDVAQDGLWRVSGSRQVIYAKHDLSLHDQIEAANRLINAGR